MQKGLISDVFFPEVCKSMFKSPIYYVFSNFQFNMLDRISKEQQLQICKWLDGLWSRYNHSTKSISAIFPQMCFKTEGHQDIGTNMFMCKVCDVKLTSEVD